MAITATQAAHKPGGMRPQLTAFQKETLEGAAEVGLQAVMWGGGHPQHTVPCAARSLTDSSPEVLPHITAASRVRP